MDAVWLFSDTNARSTATAPRAGQSAACGCKLGKGETRFGCRSAGRRLRPVHRAPPRRVPGRSARPDGRPDPDGDARVQAGPRARRRRSPRSGITLPGDLDEKKLNAWLRDLLDEPGAGHLPHEGRSEHQGRRPTASSSRASTCSSTAGRPPLGQPSRAHNSLIFIGRNLDRDRLTEGFRSCLA